MIIDIFSKWFLQGLLHPVLTATHLILMLGVGFFIGQQGKKDLLQNLLIFLTSVILGLVVNHHFVVEWNLPLILMILSLIVGLLVALAFHLPVIVTLPVVFSCGFLLGLDSIPVVIPGIRQHSIVNWLTGAGFSLVALTTFLSLISYFLRRPLQGMILRVWGAWITASAIFVLTLQLTQN